MVTRIDICNRALVRIGLDPVESEQSAGADAVVFIYDSVTEDILSSYDWHFGHDIIRLGRLATGPVNQWLYAYQLPSLRLGPPREVYSHSSCERPLRAYELSRDRLLSDADEIWVDVKLRRDPIDWPGYFRELVVRAMMAELAISLREDKGLWDRYQRQCYGRPAEEGMGGLMGKAMTLDSQSKPSPVFEADWSPLRDARFS